MRKKLLVFLAIATVSFQITSCTSNKAQDDSEVIENADVDKIEAEDSFAEGTDSSLLEEDPSMQAALGEESTPGAEGVDGALAESTSIEDSVEPELPTDVAAAPTLDESSLSDVPPPATDEVPTDLAALDSSSELPPPITNDVVAEAEAPVAEPEIPVAQTETPSFENSDTNTAALEPAPERPAKVSKPADSLKKVALTAPYQANGGWVNTVYVARPGETLKEISQKVFASDKTKELKKIAENNYLKWRSVRPGDKIYYISPNRPEDSATTLLYYEDMGMVPETYVAKKGDNLKKVAKEILGYEKAYVEMWTSNPVESKGKLNEGETLRYWRSASGVTGQVAANTNSGNAQLIDSTQAPQMMPPPPMPEAQNTPPPADMMPPPPDDQALLPPPPDQSMPAMDQPPAETASLPPPPPPPPMETAPPPSIDEVAAAPTAPMEDGSVDEEVVEGLDNDTMMSLGAVGVLTAALAFALIRRKKKKAAEMAAAMNETHVGS
ncbi:MAG: hypothetical protein A2622_05455 [Bdellovibrionales bacterium RIFCSPHIGHO2_01_FULL_40_29]|nr:MAG: hypothetical protein A2622_05455 [Bdellovibrionales bacterium RIFCSPHIGHO2_01_FULL_40_29]OFZ33155.1 MAG: hypothetical protein A3D17_13415 [Bdellovibrionales bacterium RIFCSPHIGHO2_02_FULL_40_15]